MEGEAGHQIKWVEANNRVLGRNRIPACILVPTAADAFIVLPGDAAESTAFGQRNFDTRHGLASKHLQIRFRILDQQLSMQGLTDLAVPAPEFAQLTIPVQRVFITKNEISGLAFPALPESLVIFGWPMARRMAV